MQASFIALAGLLVASAASAQVTVPASSLAAPLPAFPGDGLSATIWSGGSGSISTARTVAAGASVGSFHATTIDYPNGSAQIVGVTDPISTFLGADAPSLTTLPGSAGVADLVFIFSGYIAIAAPGTYTFSVGSDDGFELLIGGQSVTSFNSDRPFNVSSGDASFTDAGLYPIELLYWANGQGQSGVEFSRLIAGSSNSEIVPQSALYSVIPTPSAGLAFALAALGVSRRRRA